MDRVFFFFFTDHTALNTYSESTGPHSMEHFSVTSFSDLYNNVSVSWDLKTFLEITQSLSVIMDIWLSEVFFCDWHLPLKSNWSAQYFNLLLLCWWILWITHSHDFFYLFIFFCIQYFYLTVTSWWIMSTAKAVYLIYATDIMSKTLSNAKISQQYLRACIFIYTFPSAVCETNTHIFPGSHISKQTVKPSLKYKNLPICISFFFFFHFEMTEIIPNWHESPMSHLGAALHFREPFKSTALSSLPMNAACH